MPHGAMSMDENFPSLSILAIRLYPSIQKSVVHPYYKGGSMDRLYLLQRRYGKERAVYIRM